MLFYVRQHVKEGDEINRSDDYVRIEDLVMEAIEETIPDSFLDARISPDGVWE